MLSLSYITYQSRKLLEEIGVFSTHIGTKIDVSVCRGLKVTIKKRKGK
jgi:hypothetical protein